ncbi:MAG: hypothetical protein NTZ97_03115 [Candidatus Moranbacteria bacterium]|nr:hypothetical protein [Candidatus Moranbacteria bacterium]
MGTKKKLGIGAGLAAVAVAAAGIYFLYGTKKGAKTRKQIRGWMLKAKGEILEKMENMKDLSEEAYDKIIDEVSAKYKVVKSIDKKDLEQFAKELKSHWKDIKKEMDKKINPKKGKRK